MQKFLDFTVNTRFITGAVIGAGAAFGLQIFILGDVSFWQFWLSNVAGAAVVGSLFRAFR